MDSRNRILYYDINVTVVGRITKGRLHYQS